MRYTVAALALAGAAMAGEGYYTNTKEADPVYPDPTYTPVKEADPIYPDPTYPTTYPNDYPTDYPTDYPHDYPTSLDDPLTPYPTTYYPTYYPTTTKKDDSWPTTSCSDDYDSGKYPHTSTKKYDHEYDHDYYTTSTIYTTKVHVVTKGHDYETITDKYPVTTTVYAVVKTKAAEKEYPEKDYKPTYPVSKVIETKKYEATAAPQCPTYSVKTIHTSITTVVPTVIYETVAIPCPTGKPIPTGSYPNSTYPKKPVTAGASGFAVSSLVAAAAGLAAFALL